MTARGTPSFKVTYSPCKQFVIPISIDGSYKRFEQELKAGWNIKAISLLNGKIAVSIEKDYPEVTDNRRNIVGIDVGSSTLAAVTVYDTRRARVIKQLYLGRESMKLELQSLEVMRIKVLRRLKHKQANFIKTRSGQIATEIVKLANKYDASVAVEKLSIRGRKYRMNRKANRKINHIPYAGFKEFIKSNCLTNTNPKLFFQLTRAGVAVNQLFRPADGVICGAVHYTKPPMESPRI